MFRDERNANSAYNLCKRRYELAEAEFFDKTRETIDEDLFKEYLSEVKVLLEDYYVAIKRRGKLYKRPLWKKILDNLV